MPHGQTKGQRLRPLEVCHYTRMFRMLDLDSSGTLDDAEIKAIRVSLGANYPREEVNLILNVLDFTDPETTYNLPKFLACVAGSPQDDLLDQEAASPQERRKRNQSHDIQLRCSHLNDRVVQDTSPNFHDETMMHDNAIEAFSRFDKDGNGVIDHCEAYHVLNRVLGMSEMDTSKLIREFDKRGDNKLTFEEFQAFFAKIKQMHKDALHAFHQFDPDAEGRIRRAEAYMVLHQDLGFTRPQVAALLNRQQLDEDGRITYHEFVRLYQNVRAKGQAATAAFQWFDINQDGFISLQEAENVLQYFLGFTPEQVACLVQECDRDGDGRLNYAEFVGFYENINSKKSMIVNMLQKYDPNTQGWVSVEDMRLALKTLLFSSADIQRLVRLYEEEERVYLNSVEMLCEFS